MDFDPRMLFEFLRRRKPMQFGGRADMPAQKPMDHYDTGDDYVRMISESRNRGLPPKMSYASAQPYSVEVGEPQIQPQYAVEVGNPVMDAGSQMRDVSDYEPSGPSYEETLNPTMMAYHAARKQARRF